MRIKALAIAIICALLVGCSKTEVEPESSQAIPPISFNWSVIENQTAEASQSDREPMLRLTDHQFEIYNESISIELMPTMYYDILAYEDYSELYVYELLPHEVQMICSYKISPYEIDGGEHLGKLWCLCYTHTQEVALCQTMLS